jgi:hypothetical protein
MITTLVLGFLGYLVIRHFLKRLSPRHRSKHKRSKTKNESYAFSAFRHFTNRHRANTAIARDNTGIDPDDYLSDGRVILHSDEPDMLPPLPRYPLSGRAAHPAPKTARWISPWGGTMGSGS